MGSNIPGTLATAGMLATTVMLAAQQKYEHLQQQRPNQDLPIRRPKISFVFLEN
jgi:hypothetical protein